MSEHSTSPKTPSLVNLNTATSTELRTLPGVGPALARAILSDREAAGEYGRAEDLLHRVPLMGIKRWAKIAGLVYVVGDLISSGPLEGGHNLHDQIDELDRIIAEPGVGGWPKPEGCPSCGCPDCELSDEECAEEEALRDELEACGVDTSRGGFR